MLPQSPYSPNMFPRDFFLFPRLKRDLKGRQFKSIEAVQATMTRTLNSISEKELQDAYSRNAGSAVQMPKEVTLENLNHTLSTSYLVTINRVLQLQSGFIQDRPCILYSNIVARQVYITFLFQNLIFSSQANHIFVIPTECYSVIVSL